LVSADDELCSGRRQASRPSANAAFCGDLYVSEGAKLIPTLDAHSQHPGVFSEEELVGFATADAPASQIASQ